MYLVLALILNVFQLWSFGRSNAMVIKDFENNDDSELVLVSVIFRHGARTTYEFYPNDPYINETFYPYGLGQLTNEGKRGEFKLGKYLHYYYSKFLGEDWTKDKLSVRSTDSTRTKMSALLVLASLFPPSKNLTWNSDFNWLPIPVDYKSSKKEDIFNPNCDFKKKIFADLDNIPEVQEKFLNPYKEIYNFVEEKSGATIRNPDKILDFYFIVKTESDMNYTLPDWTKEVFPGKIEEPSSLCYAYHNYNVEAMKINTGYMLQKILSKCEKKIKNPGSERKMYLYSGHETNVGYMLDALKVTDPHIPTYGSALSFELRRKDDKYFMKLMYRNDTESMTGNILKLPNCDVLCPYDDFLKQVNYVIPTMTLEKACQQNYTVYKSRES